MAITNFTGTLNPNKIFGAIYNMIISQEVFADNVKGTYSSLVDKARVDGSMYGDTKLYYSVDVLQTHDWLNDAEAANLLALDRPAAPSVQKITIDQFRQIRLTVDNYLTKQAWSTEGAFSSFNSVMLGMIRDTKRIYDSTLYNAFIGTNETDEGEQSITITPISGQNDALTMAEALADLLVALKDVSRDYNDYGYMRSFEESDLHVIWNAKVYNTLKKIDMPVIFHKDGLLNEFEQSVLPARYFGTIVGPSASTLFTVPEGTDTYRILIEKDITVGGETVHLFPGEKIPAGAQVPQNEVYKEDDTIAFKLIHKRSVPYMSAFEVATSFFNPRSLTENNYLTFGYNTLEHLAQFPFITARFAE
jgi:hypothetical protein